MTLESYKLFLIINFLFFLVFAKTIDLLCCVHCVTVKFYLAFLINIACFKNTLLQTAQNEGLSDRLLVSLFRATE